MKLYLRLAAIVLACVIVPLALSCGSMMTIGMSLDDSNNPYWNGGASLYDGLWMGKYVWYRGEWRFLGNGTPYFYDPTNYYWQ
jgi:hypothetical protein